MVKIHPISFCREFIGRQLLSVQETLPEAITNKIFNKLLTKSMVDNRTPLEYNTGSDFTME